MEQGYSTREAARIAGINLRTGKKWRNGHRSPGKGLKAVLPIFQDPGQTPVGPQDLEEPPAPSRYLQEHDRIHTPEYLETVAAELNSRPRKTLGWGTPAERLAKLLATAS